MFRFTKELVVRESNLTHNHRIGPDIAMHYPSNRKLSTEECTTVSEMLTLRLKTKHFKEMIGKKYGKMVTLKDIHIYGLG